MREQFHRVHSDFSNDAGLPFGRSLGNDYFLSVREDDGLGLGTRRQRREVDIRIPAT